MAKDRRSSAIPEDRRSDAGAREPVRLNRTFFEKKPPAVVVVELGDATDVATRRPTDSLLTRLSKAVRKDPRPVFDQAPTSGPHALMARTLAGGMTVASGPGPDSEFHRFTEFEVGDEAAAAEMSKELAKEFEDEILSVLPAPQAVPAIAPSYAESAPSVGRSPDFRHRQIYLEQAPLGVGAARAWAAPGGAGQGVTVIDIEGGWQLSHENLAGVRFNQWGGDNSALQGWRDHGTAVVGILAGGSGEATGTIGVCPGARVGMYSVFEGGATNRQRVANSILRAGQLLGPGDVLLVELQRPGPRTNYQSDPDQKGYLPAMYWPDIRAAVRAVTGMGVTVVAVGGNGADNLDDPSYEKRLDPATNDSGAILVAAGAPPGGQYGPARSRLDFSNYGSCMDVQCWGQSVTTSGYGDLWGGEGADNAYTGAFMGTSAAAPIVAGVVACLQGRHKAVHGVPMHPLAVRQVLRTFGWKPELPDDDQVRSQMIGLQPDLGALFQVLGLA